MTLPWLDLALAAAILWIAWVALSSRDLFRGVVLFIVFGLLMALAWTRLEAPDIALAEAAIGAGLTGALLLDAVAQFAPAGRPPVRAPSPHVGAKLLGGLAALALAAVLLIAFLDLPTAPGGLTTDVAQRIERSGAAHPVTAVLLDFRSFDTWLEVWVLLLAVLAALIVRRSADLRDVAAGAAADPLLVALPRVLVPAMVLAAGYLLWLGTHAPGGAFQAGAVLASAAVLLLLAGRRSVAALAVWPLRLALLAGVLAFLAVALGTLAAGRGMLDLPESAAGTLVVLVEAAVAVSIAVTLSALFAAARPALPPPTGSGS